ncbi:unnamed protein product [Peniophora sp. CBMAI 1063]|nr:unnamed protein product [Peniophora sp. CBMAI 1063]
MMPEEQTVPEANVTVDSGATPTSPTIPFRPSWITEAGKEAWRVHRAQHGTGTADENCDFCSFTREDVHAFAQQFEDDGAKRGLLNQISELEGRLAATQSTQSADAAANQQALTASQQDRDAKAAEIQRLVTLMEQASASFEQKLAEELARRPHTHSAETCLECAKMASEYKEAVAAGKLAQAAHSGCGDLLAAAQRERITLEGAVGAFQEESARWRKVYNDLRDDPESRQRKRPKGSADGAQGEEHGGLAPSASSASGNQTSSTSATSSGGGGTTASTPARGTHIPQLMEGNPERPEPGTFRRFNWFEWARYQAHHARSLDDFIHGVICSPKAEFKANTQEHTMRGEAVSWATTGTLVGRDRQARYFGRPQRYPEMVAALELQINPQGRLERGEFTENMSDGDITRWFADHGLAVDEGRELFGWAKTYIERRWMKTDAPGRNAVPDDIRVLWTQIQNIAHRAILPPKFEHKQWTSPAPVLGDVPMQM